MPEPFRNASIGQPDGNRTPAGRFKTYLPRGGALVVGALTVILMVLWRPRGLSGKAV